MYTIYPLRYGVFYPDQLVAMASAFDHACYELSIHSTDDVTRESIALSIVFSATRGENDRGRLANRAILEHNELRMSSIMELLLGGCLHDRSPVLPSWPSFPTEH